MNVKDAMTHEIKMIRPDTPLREAARKMRDHDIGMLPVYDGQQLLGVVTDRDITVRALAEERDPDKTTAADVLTRDVATCFDDDDVGVASHRMKELQIRRLLVVNREQRPVGVIGLGDIAKKEECASLAGEALSGVCQPTA